MRRPPPNRGCCAVGGWNLLRVINCLRVILMNGHSNCNCNCNLFVVHKSKLGYSPVDIDIVAYMSSNIIYIESE